MDVGPVVVRDEHSAGVSDILNDGRPFLTSNLPMLGLTRDRLRALLREHRVRRCLHRVYVSTDVPDSRDLRIAALRLVIPSYGVLYGCTAAWVHTVDTLAPSKRFDLVPQCVVPHGMGRCKTSGVQCVEGYLPPADVVEIGDLRTTTPVRTTTDLLRRLRRPYALAAADGMAHAGLIKVGEVTAHLSRLKGFPGIVQARELAPMIEPLAESPGESWQRLRLVDAGFPKPRAQFVVRDHKDRIVARLDHGYPEVRVGAEYDGKEFHEHAEDQENDVEKRDYLRGVLGWRIEVAGKEAILGRDDAFERTMGGYLGINPQLPRQW